MNQLIRFNPQRAALRAVLAVSVLVLGAGYSHMASAMPAGGHGGYAGHGGHEMGMGSPRHMDRLLDVVKATPEQRAQIKQISEAARADMAAQRDTVRKLHEQNRALFAQPTVDARSAEALRQQMMAQHEQASKRMLQVKLEISRVLTPEQRALLSERMQQRGEMMQRHRERDGQEKPRT
jgi:Spy/CpxP family protein refolding chaperone